MHLFNELCLRYEESDWVHNPEFGLLDAILETHPEVYTEIKDDILLGTKVSKFGRKEVPSVEQIVRAALYKELKGLDYRELEYSQLDSRICSTFIK